MVSLSVSAYSSMAAEQVVISGKEVQRPVEMLRATIDEFDFATNDEFDFVTVEMKEKMDPTIFASILRASVSHWRLQGRKGVWLKLPIALVNLVPAAVDEGFSYHHAVPEYLMLACWLHETKQVLPSYATNRVHVGAFVMNDERKVLVVKENSGMFKRMGLWKFPTGFAEEGEDIFEAAKREVKEETGIDSQFVEILGFRHSHKQFHGKSNLFFVCMLRPLSFVIRVQKSELEDAMWMPLEEFAAQSLVKEVEFLRYMHAICKAKVEEGYSGFSQLRVSGFPDDGGQSSFYFNDKDLDLKNATCKAKVDEGYSGFSRLPVSGFPDDDGKSSFYFNDKGLATSTLCALKTIQMPVPKPYILSSFFVIIFFSVYCLQWMPLEESAAQPLVDKDLDLKTAICKAKVDGGYSGFSQLPVSRFPDDDGKSSSKDLDLKNAICKAFPDDDGKSSFYFNHKNLDLKKSQ